MTIRVHRTISLALSAFTLAACASNYQADPNLSPAEQQMRAETEQQRNVEGAMVGCLIGGILGALVNDGNPGAGAAVGCAGGGATGYVASEYVNEQNAGYADAQTAAYGVEENARQATAYYRESTQTVLALIDQEKRKIASLNSQYRANQISAEQYRRQVASAQENIDLVYSQVRDLEDTLAQIDSELADYGGTDEMYYRRNELAAERENLLRAAAQLQQLYSREIPAEVRTGG